MNYSVIIAEFNPLTLGHKKIIEKTKELFPSDGILVILSSAFVQRGEPSIVSPSLRAKVATKLGVDAVLELPVYFSSSSAEDFALGAVKIASAIPSTKRIIFGSECGDIEALIKTQEELEKHEKSKEVKENLKNGLSFKTSILNSLPNKYSNILNSPNNMLGVMYLKSIKALSSHLDAITIKREDNFNDKALSSIPSATALRSAIQKKAFLEIEGKMPDEMLDIVKKAQTPSLDKFYSMIYQKLLTSTHNNLSHIYGISEGLEYRIKDVFLNQLTLDELVDSLKSKRHNGNKIRRILLNILLNKTQDVMTLAKTIPPIIKVLSVNTNKNQVLKDLSLASGVVLTKAKDLKNLSIEQQVLYDMSCLADNIYAFITNDKNLIPLGKI